MVAGGAAGALHALVPAAANGVGAAADGAARARRRPVRQLAAAKRRRRLRQRLAVPEPSRGARALVGAAQGPRVALAALRRAAARRGRLRRQPTQRLVQARRRLLAAPARVSAAVRYLLGRERFDLLWATFSAPHFAGHFLWGRTDPGLEDTVAEVYEAVDAAIGEILAALPGDADAIVLSPIGMGPFTSRADMLPEVLEAVLGRRTNGAAAGSSAFRLRAAVPSGLRAAVASALPAGVVHELAARLYLQGVYWSRTRAFALPGEHNGYVRLNVRGRERDGVVEPGQVGDLLDELAAGIATFRDDDGGEAVAAVERPQVGEGPGAALLPDLVVRWADRPSEGVRALRSERFGEVRRHGTPGLSGHHREEAWAVVCPGASRERVLGRPPRLPDVAATVCALLDGDAAGIAGEPLLER